MNLYIQVALVLFFKRLTLAQERFPALANLNGSLKICFFCDLRCINEIKTYGYSKSRINDYYKDSVHNVSKAFADNGVKVNFVSHHVLKFNSNYDDLLFGGTDNDGSYNLGKLTRYFFTKRIPVKSWSRVGCNITFWTPASDDLILRNNSVHSLTRKFQLCKEEPYGIIKLNKQPAKLYARELLHLMGVYHDDELPRSTYHYKLFEPMNMPVLKYCRGKKGVGCPSGKGNCIMSAKLKKRGILKMSTCTKAYLEFWLQVGDRYPTVYSHKCIHWIVVFIYMCV